MSLAEDFDAHRGRLLSVGYRVTGSVVDAEDAVQKAWFRRSRTDASQIGDLRPGSPPSSVASLVIVCVPPRCVASGTPVNSLRWFATTGNGSGTFAELRPSEAVRHSDEREARFGATAGMRGMIPPSRTLCALLTEETM